MSSILKFLIIFTLFFNCYNTRIVMKNSKSDNILRNGKLHSNIFENDSLEPNCEGLHEVQIDRPFEGFLADMFGVAPSIGGIRRIKYYCILQEKVNNSLTTEETNFTDTVSLKNGTVLTDVKVAVTAESVVVTTKTGQVTVYPKNEILSIKKK